MSQIIYMVNASKGYAYEGDTTSVVLTTFSEDEAVAFAKEYLARNEALTVAEQFYDYLSVNVTSTVIGTSNTEALVWSSYGREISAEDNDANLDFAFDLEAALIAKFKKQISLNIREHKVIQPTLGFGAGIMDLIQSVNSINVSSIHFAVDYYRNHLKMVRSAFLTEAVIATGSTLLVEEDADSEENQMYWALYNKYEKPHYLN